MKKLFLFSVIMMCMIMAKAQYTSMTVINNSGRTDLYVYFYGNDGTPPACSLTNSSIVSGALPAGTPVTFNTLTVPWSPASTSVVSITSIGFEIIPTIGLPEPGPVVAGTCGSVTVPMSPYAYVFARGSRNNLNFLVTAPGKLQVTINP